MNQKILLIGGLGIGAYLYLSGKQAPGAAGTTAVASGGKIVTNPNQGAGNAQAAGYAQQTDQQGSLLYGHVGPTPADVVNAGNTSDVPSAPLHVFHSSKPGAAQKAATAAQQRNAIQAYKATLSKDPVGYANAFLSLNAAQQYAQINGSAVGGYRQQALFASGKIDRTALLNFINWNNQNNVGTNATAPAARSYQSFLT